MEGSPSFGGYLRGRSLGTLSCSDVSGARAGGGTADALDLGSSTFGCEGSSPSRPTTTERGSWAHGAHGDCNSPVYGRTGFDSPTTHVNDITDTRARDDDNAQLTAYYDEAQQLLDVLLGTDWERFHDYGPTSLRDAVVAGRVLGVEQSYHPLDTALERTRRRFAD